MTPAKRQSPLLLSLLLFGGLSGLSGGLFAYLDRLHAAAFQRHIEVVAHALQPRLEESLALRLALVAAVASELEQVSDDSFPFEARATSIQEQFPGYQAINRISSDGRIVQVVPLESNQGALGLSVFDHPTAGDVLRAASSTGQPQVSPPLTLFQGGVGFTSYFPVAGGQRGYVNGVFRIAPVVERLLTPQLRADLQVSLLLDTLPLYVGDSHEPLYPAAARSVGITVADQRWTLQVVPTQALRRSYHPISTYALLVLGLLSAAGVSLLLYRSRVQRDQQHFMEQQLQQVRRMEALGTLAGGVAHDFNNVLTVFYGTLELNLLSQQPDTPLHRDLSMLLDCCEKAASLTRQLLLFAQHPINRQESFSPDALLTSSERLLRRLLPESITLHTHLSAGDAVLYGDPGILQQALLNLALNARDAMPAGGSLTITTQVQEHALWLAVRDTGHGMDRATRERIFDPFFTTKDPGKGTGLGLAMVYRTVSGLGGHIHVESAPGQGACFTLQLPLHSGPLTTPAAPPALPPPQRPELRVLVVDDSDPTRQTIARMLRAAGHTVVEAEDGEHALAQPGPFQLLVTDVVMPGLGGPALAARMRQQQPDLRVLLCTGYPDQDLRPFLDAAPHSTAVLLKPFTREQLLAALAPLLSP